MSHAPSFRRLLVAGSLLVPTLALPIVVGSAGTAVAAPDTAVVHVLTAAHVHGVAGVHAHGTLSRTWV